MVPPEKTKSLNTLYPRKIEISLVSFLLLGSFSHHDDVIKWKHFPSKQWWGWWFESLSCPLWRHCNDSDNAPCSLSMQLCCYSCLFNNRCPERLSKQWWGWWFETPSHHYDVIVMTRFCCALFCFGYTVQSTHSDGCSCIFLVLLQWLSF